MPEWFTYAKARASFAQVGNDMDAYQLYNTYSIGSDPNGNTTAGQGKTKYDADVRSELITSWEAGAELNFSQNKSKIIELLPGKPGMQYALGGSDALQVYAVAGGA